MRIGKKLFVGVAKTVMIMRLRIADAVFRAAAVTEFIPIALQAPRFVFGFDPAEPLLLRRIKKRKQIIAVQVAEKRFVRHQKVATVAVAVVFDNQIVAAFLL